MDTVADELRRDIDMVRYHIIKRDTNPVPAGYECTLEEELQPPAYRKDVQKLIEEGKKKEKPGYKQNSPGFDYYPFQR